MASRVRRITIEVPAAEVSAELMRRGIGAETRVQIVAEVLDASDAGMPLAALAQAGGAFDWLTEEPDLYSDADLDERS